MSKTKDLWENYGATDPYYAVATFEKFRSKNLTDTAKAEFFQSGEVHISRVWTEIENKFQTVFRPEQALDFGCGVGRLIIPIAAKAGRVTGIDISQNMLSEAERNCELRGLENVEFLQTDEFLKNKGPEFDFVHSSIVFQHIEPVVGLRILSKILERLKSGGIGALHFTYSTKPGAKQSLLSKIYRDLPLAYRLRGLVKTNDDQSMIPMYLYDVNKILKALQEHNCHDVHIRFSDHGLFGILIFFQKGKAELF